MCGARLPGRFGLGGIPEKRDCFPVSRCRRTMLESQELPAPLFTPTTTADSGHDMPMTVEEMGVPIASSWRIISKKRAWQFIIFARKQAITKGIIIADTKFEFRDEGDKTDRHRRMLTPDSSRFWDAKSYKPGQSQPSYDKQPVRELADRFRLE